MAETSINDCEASSARNTTSKQALVAPASAMAPQPQYKRFSDLIGNTPLIDLTALAAPKVDGVKVLAKAEFMNPGLSIKDRIIRNIIDQAEASGRLKPGMTIIAASSGNTGAALAMISAMRGYKAIVTTNRKCSAEKMNAIRAYGAELIVTPDGVGIDSPDHYMNVPQVYTAADPDKYFDIDQYDNLKNPEAYYKTLAPEIWEQTCGTITHFVAGASTGGTISGTGRYLKERNPAIQCVMPDPVGSIFKQFYDTGHYDKAKKYLIEGVGKDTVPGALDISLVDEIIVVSDQQAFDMCHRLCQTEGVLAGGSAGMNLHAAIEIANRATEPCTVVTVLCDSGVKYLSKVYNPEYLEDNGLTVSEHQSSE
jgi:cysteine synthase